MHLLIPNRDGRIFPLRVVVRGRTFGYRPPSKALYRHGYVVKVQSSMKYRLRSNARVSLSCTDPLICH